MMSAFWQGFLKKAKQQDPIEDWLKEEADCRKVVKQRTGHYSEMAVRQDPRELSEWHAEGDAY